MINAQDARTITEASGVEVEKYLNSVVDVSMIAKAFGGGGHLNAAEFSVEMGTLLEWLK